jgi:hypothetical protein
MFVSLLIEHNYTGLFEDYISTQARQLSYDCLETYQSNELRYNRLNHQGLIPDSRRIIVATTSRQGLTYSVLEAPGIVSSEQS